MKTRRFILTMAIVLLTVLGVDAQKTYVLVTGVSSYQCQFSACLYYQLEIFC